MCQDSRLSLYFKLFIRTEVSNEIIYHRYPESGWTCPDTNLFGENKNTDVAAMYSGIYWRSFGGPKQSLKEVRMAIRPADFDPNLSIQSVDQDDEYELFEKRSQNAVYR